MFKEIEEFRNKEIKLKKCPFCGNEAEYLIDSEELADTTQRHRIKCKSLLCASITTYISIWQLDYASEVKKFIKKWNTRVYEDKGE